MTINCCNTKKYFPEYSFHVNFRKSQETSAKLNDSVKTYNKKTNWESRIAQPPSRNRVNQTKIKIYFENKNKIQK